MTGCYQVSTTLDDEAAAGRLAACVQIIGPIRSVYRWDGAVTQAAEWLCTAKTVEARLPALLSRIRTLHSYQQPEILASAIHSGDPGYLDWLQRETAPNPEAE